jgi:hypothetical protein
MIRLGVSEVIIVHSGTGTILRNHLYKSELQTTSPNFHKMMLNYYKNYVPVTKLLQLIFR